MFAATWWCLAAFAVAAVVARIPDAEDLERRGKGWNVLDGGAKRSCVGLNGRPGVCMGQNQCEEMSGKSVGRCFPFDSCCSVTPNSCGGYSGASTAYFQSPDKFQEVCAFKINVRRNVCQIRIDFERFSIGKPTKPYNESAYACERDEFILFSNENTKMNLPVLCGENSGQHVYVPVVPQTTSDLNNRQQITLKFRLTTRDEHYNDPQPFWKLKISQLECQTTSTNWWKIKDIARQVWDWEEDEKDAKTSKYSLAPDGCLQYFTEKEGSFESFNYDKGLGHYLGNLNYAVCFKRNKDTCGIQYKAVKFLLAYNQNLTNSTDRDCDTLTAALQTTTLAPTTTTAATTTTTVASTSTAAPARDARKRKWTSDLPNVHSDYLLIPDGLYSERFFASKYCYKSLENFNEITVNTQGPLYVAFVSDEYSNSGEDVEKGYKIDYSLINTGC